MYSPTVYDPPLGHAHYRHFKMPDEWKPIIKKIIGREGCNFIKATIKSRCKYIWHHRDTDIIEIWGPMANIMNGEKCVRDIARKYLNGDARQSSPKGSTGTQDNEEIPPASSNVQIS
tara:strand:- start:1013 stop:1363 length:351 start_codon:yes stop_codon:yes gene_type:complete